jgi:hypothetical protein
MKKSKEIKNLDNEIDDTLISLSELIIQYKKKVKKEFINILIDEKVKLLEEIAN